MGCAIRESASERTYSRNMNNLYDLKSISCVLRLCGMWEEERTWLTVAVKCTNALRISFIGQVYISSCFYDGSKVAAVICVHGQKNRWKQSHSAHMMKAVWSSHWKLIQPMNKIQMAIKSNAFPLHMHFLYLMCTLANVRPPQRCGFFLSKADSTSQPDK